MHRYQGRQGNSWVRVTDAEVTAITYTNYATAVQTKSCLTFPLNILHFPLNILQDTNINLIYTQYIHRCRWFIM